jgi:hypothetical protein
LLPLALHPLLPQVVHELLGPRLHYLAVPPFFLLLHNTLGDWHLEELKHAALFLLCLQHFLPSVQLV